MNARPVAALARGAIFLAAITLAAYSNGLTDTFPGLDAKESIRDNPHIRQLWPLSEAMSLDMWKETLAKDPGAKGGSVVRRPVLSLTFALNARLLGLQAWTFQLVNILIHLAAGLLCFGLVRRTLELPRFGGAYAGRSTWIALAIAGLWLVHPIQTESVTYVVQRAESLMGFFYLGTLYCFLRGATAVSGTSWFGLATLACALGMATKEGMVTAPVVVLLYDLVFLSDSMSESLRRRAKAHAALFLSWLVLALLIVTTMADVRRDFEEGRTLAYMLGEPGVLLHYLRLSLWPQPLHLYVNSQEFLFHAGITPITEVLVAATAVAGLVFLGLFGLVRRTTWGFLIVTFFILLSPSSTFVATSDPLQEHRLYLPLLCIIAFVIGAIDVGGRWLARTVPPLAWCRHLPLLFAAGALPLCIYQTRARNLDYHSEFGMIYPADLPEAVSITVRHEHSRGDSEEVFRLIDAALATATDPPIRARIYARLGLLQLNDKRYVEAEEQFRNALAEQPKYEIAVSNLAVVLAIRGDTGGAEELLQGAMRSGPGLALTRNNLAVLQAKRGDTADAAKLLRDTLVVHMDWEILRKNAEFIEATGAAEIAQHGLALHAMERAGEIGLLLLFEGLKPDPSLL